MLPRSAGSFDRFLGVFTALLRCRRFVAILAPLFLAACAHDGTNFTASSLAGCEPTNAAASPACAKPFDAIDDATMTIERALGADGPEAEASPQAKKIKQAIAKTRENPLAVAPRPAIRSTKGRPLGLAEAVAQAVLTFPEIRINEARVREANASIGITRSGLFPRLDANIAAGINSDGQYSGRSLIYSDANTSTDGRFDSGLVFRQLLYDFGAIGHDVDRAKLLHDSERYKLVEKIDEIAFKTAQLYTRIFEQRAILALIDETIASNRELLTIVLAQANDGQGTQADVDRVKSRLQEVNSVRADASLQLLGAEDQFERLTRLRPGPLAPLLDLRQHIPRDADRAIAVALANNPRLAALSTAKQSSEKELDFQKASSLPKLTLEAQTDSQDYRNGRSGRAQISARAMVALRFRILDGGLADATEHQIRARILGGELALLNEREQVESDIRQAYRAIASAARKSQLVADGVDSAGRVRALYLEQFKVGKRTIFELLDGQMSFYTARRSQIESKYEGARAMLDILRANGDLTSVLAGIKKPAAKAPKS